MSILDFLKLRKTDDWKTEDWKTERPGIKDWERGSKRTGNVHDIRPITPLHRARSVRHGKVPAHIRGRVGLVGVIISVVLTDGLARRRVASRVHPELVRARVDEHFDFLRGRADFHCHCQFFFLFSLSPSLSVFLSLISPLFSFFFSSDFF